jgi:hypothetical protein
VEAAPRGHDAGMDVRGQRGQVSAEYLGVLLLVAVVVGAFIATGIGGTIASEARNAVCKIAGAECAEGTTPGGPTTRAELLAALERREQALAPLGERGEGYGDLLAQARAARERGDLEEADRLLDLLEFYSRLSESDRGDLVDALNGPSADDFAALVAQGTIDEEGGRNRRYFQVPPSPGDGLIVQDFFIPTASSGGLLAGDDRDTVDPLLGDASLDDSRIVVVIDRETGRGVITQSETCTAGPLPDYCEGARPIELRDPRLEPQGNPFPGQAPQEFRVEAGDGYVEIEYDALNSITPFGVSVDGTVRFERGEDGGYEKVEDSRDPYPRIVTGQYRPGEEGGIIDETDDQPVFPGALPEPVRDVIETGGDVVDTACEVPGWVGGLGGVVAHEVVC